MGSLYGGTAGLIRIRGHEEMLDKPLDLGDVLPGAFERLQIFDRWCGVTPEDRVIFFQGQLVPEYYDINDAENRLAAQVHHSRIVRFTGGCCPIWSAWPSRSQHEINSITATENFVLGFRLGIRLMAECMDDNDGEIRSGGE